MFQDVDVLIQVRFVPELGRGRFENAFFFIIFHFFTQGCVFDVPTNSLDVIEVRENMMIK